MRREGRNFLTRGSAQEHLEAAMNQQRNLAAHQHAGLADAHLARTEVLDDRAAAVASHAAAPGGFDGGRKPELLQTGDAFLEALNLGLLIAKKHRIPIIVAE